MDDSERLQRLSVRVLLLEQRLDELERQRDAAQGNGEEGRSGNLAIGSSATMPMDGASASAIPGSGAAAADRSAPSPASSERAALANLLYDTYYLTGKTSTSDWYRMADFVLEREAALRAQLAEREEELERLRDDAADYGSAVLKRFDVGAARYTDLYTYISCILRDRERVREELAALRSSERERLIADVCSAWDNRPISSRDPAPVNFGFVLGSLSAYERARRAKEKP